jgi:hypothetical protein
MYIASFFGLSVQQRATKTQNFQESCQTGRYTSWQKTFCWSAFLVAGRVKICEKSVIFILSRPHMLRDREWQKSHASKILRKITLFCLKKMTCCSSSS